MRGFDADSPNETVGTIQLALFWRANVVVSPHNNPCASVAEMRQALEQEQMRAPGGASRLLYAIERRVFDRYLPTMLKIEARLEEIEDLLLERPDDKLLGESMEFSSQLKRLRRICGYHEKSLASLRGHDQQRHGLQAAQFTDLSEQAERLSSLARLQYEITSDLINGYISLSSHRLNNVMRMLTVVTVLLVPLTLYRRRLRHELSAHARTGHTLWLLHRARGDDGADPDPAGRLQTQGMDLRQAACTPSRVPVRLITNFGSS